VNASDLTANALAILHELYDGERHYSNEICAKINLKKSTFRSSVQRMIAFGLVNESEDLLSQQRRLEYRITTEGKKLLSQFNQDSEILAKRQLPQREQLPSISQWLRMQAQVFTEMAEHMESYDE